MKNIIILIFLTGIFFTSCIKDPLDRKPLNLISDDDVWVSEQLIDLYLASLYNAFPFGWDNGTGDLPFLANFTDESSYHEESPTVSNFGNHRLALNTTMYSWIRKANYFLDRVQTATVTEAQIKNYVGEVRFIRAYYYFDLARKYGGMPIIEEVQVFDDNLDELQVSRNTEDELYTFILKELDAAIQDLPDSRDGSNANRATKMMAQGLKSRAALYAGSIAKYGTVQLNGLVGIPAARANSYFAESMNASKAVMESGKYGLYDVLYNPETKAGDPVANYQQIFADEYNKEIIFQKAYSFPDKATRWDNLNIPEGFTTNYGSAVTPLLEMVESYEYIDGSPGILDVEGKEFDSPDELFKDKDPRFTASVFRSGSPFVGRTVEMHRGVYDTDGTLYESLGAPFPKDPSVSQVGASGPFPTGNYSKTGFYIRKILKLDEAVVEPGFSEQNYIEMRYAEILLNYAEAALESEADLPQALEAINLVRNRAGIKLLTMPELTIERLRNERKVELAFEDKRFWDIRRWRIGSNLFRNTTLHGLYPYLKYTGNGYKYIFEKIGGYPIDNGLPRVWEEKDNYSNLSSYISTNRNIINNLGW